MPKCLDETLLAQVVDMGGAGGVPGEACEAAFEEMPGGNGAEDFVIGDDTRQLDLRAGDCQVDDWFSAFSQGLDLVQVFLPSAKGNERAVDTFEAVLRQSVFENDGPTSFAGVAKDCFQSGQAERIEHDEDGLRFHMAGLYHRAEESCNSAFIKMSLRVKAAFQYNTRQGGNV